MIDVPVSNSDDPGYIDIVRNVVASVARDPRASSMYLICIDNWFDEKWLGFKGKALGAVALWTTRGQDVVVPPFAPGRVRSERFFERDAGGFMLEEHAAVRLHGPRSSGENLSRRVAKIAPRAALMWYTSGTLANQRGAIMAYLPTENGHDTHNMWYLGLRGDPWKYDAVRCITLHEAEALMTRAPTQ